MIHPFRDRIMNLVLQLNADYAPMKTTSWSRAVEMLLDGTAISVEDIPDKFIRSEKLVMPWPSVITLRRYKNVRNRVRFSARAVLARDNHTCQYCGFAPTLPDGRPDRNQLTMDHVVPRAQSKNGKVYSTTKKAWIAVTCWENATTACRRCNQSKADRTPLQAGMVLRSLPRLPTTGDVMRMSLLKMRGVPTAWKTYLPESWLGLGDGVQPIRKERTAVP